MILDTIQEKIYTHVQVGVVTLKKKNENYNEHYLVYKPLIWDWGLSYEKRMY